MLLEQISGAREHGWDRRLDQLAVVLVSVVPQSWKYDSLGVARNLDEMRAILLAIALNTLQLLLTGLLIMLALRRALKPLTRLAAALERRGTTDNSQLDVSAVPHEIRPLIVAFNSLLLRLEESSRAEREFLANAAHELRTPLAALQTHAEIARHASTLEEKNAAITKLLRVSERSNRLAEQLLDLARIEGRLHIEESNVDLRVLLTLVVEELRMVAESKGVALFADGDVTPVRCDVDEMGVLIRNLVDNAIRHGRAGGRVLVRCGTDVVGTRKWVVLEVLDDGPGIPEAERAQVFQRFHRGVSSDTRGSGIGLALVADVVRLHKGEVELGTGICGGVGVTVRLPAP